VARRENLLPLGLAEGAVLLTEVAKGTAISYELVDGVRDTYITRLRRLQDATVWDGD
jgi:predicted homoserine dehydrogenase-like protein